jgi:hypothetical protein
MHAVAATNCQLEHCSSQMLKSILMVAMWVGSAVVPLSLSDSSMPDPDYSGMAPDLPKNLNVTRRLRGLNLECGPGLSVET